jgi:hypothetical protein
MVPSADHTDVPISELPQTNGTGTGTGTGMGTGTGRIVQEEKIKV